MASPRAVSLRDLCEFVQPELRNRVFQDRGRAFTVPVSGDRVANDRGLVRNWCVQGHGIALKSQWDLREGRLVALLSAYETAPASLQLVFPPGGFQPRRVQLFAEALYAQLH